MTSFHPLITENPDGFYIPEIGPWGLEKYKLIGTYMNIFTVSMSNNPHWKNLMYVDLFAGAGFAKVRKSEKIFRSSALISLSIPTKFDKYIFCEENPKAYKALKHRILNYQDLDISTFHFDSNLHINRVVKEIDPYRNSTLCFCFIDPFSINIHFRTIKKLASKFRMDF